MAGVASAAFDDALEDFASPAGWVCTRATTPTITAAADPTATSTRQARVRRSRAGPELVDRASERARDEVQLLLRSQRDGNREQVAAHG